MANYNTTASVVLTVNGKQAKQMLNQCEKEAEKLRKKIDAAAKAGDKASMKKFQRELNSVNKTMEQLRGSAATTEAILTRLDKATPKELNKALKQLKMSLNGIERGSEAWNAQVEKIKRVKEEIRSLNEEMSADQSLWEKFKGWFDEWQLALAGAAAAVTGLVLAGKSAVKAYAEVEQEMANVRKFTGFTEEEVAKLNAEFKKIDTRTSVIELNKLAEEAGRLGKQSVEDVLGFVKAADVINVALDDLGEGATLTLSKLTGVFGDEERFGTERSLLKVGSVINELSQNCAASAPYIADFAERLGGVGSQAGMSVQEIMAFAAVLDSNSQSLEKSATAMSKLITNLFANPAKYATVAGLHVKEFAKLLKEDANAALIQFLEALNKAGNMDALAPMFADMGEKGSGMITTLSTLAKNIEQVKLQQRNANAAYDEGVSVLNEFEVQNNTVQAGMDKARKRFNELAVELGERLQPVMRRVISSTSLMMRATKEIVDFVISFHREIFAVVGAIALYVAATKIYSGWTAICTTATKAWSAAIALGQSVAAPFRLIIAGLTNAVQYFTNGLQVNYAMQVRWRNAMNAMKFSSWTGLILALAAAIYVVTSRIIENRKAAAEAAAKHREWQDSIRNLDKESNEYSAKELARLEQLYSAAMNEYKSREDRIKAVEQLQRLYPDVFGNMDKEAIMLGRAVSKYEELRDAIIKTARARAAAEKIQANEGAKLDLESDRSKLNEIWRERGVAYVNARQRQEGAKNAEEHAKLGVRAYQIGMLPEDKQFKISDPETGEKVLIKHMKDVIEYRSFLISRIKEINEANDELAREYDIVAGFDDSSSYGGPKIPEYGGAGSGASSGEKFEKEKQWREKEEALARIAYATGQSDFISYTERMNEIAVQFYEMQLQHADISESERLKIQADYEEARVKQKDYWNRLDEAAEEAAHNRRLTQLKQMYIDGQISKETFDLKAEEEELFHQQALVALAKEGSEERAAAEAKLQDMRISQMERRNREYLQKEAQFAKVKNEVFGDNPQEALSKFNAEMQALDVVYNRELAAAGDNAAEKLRIEQAYQSARLALQKKYNQEADADNKNVIQGFAEWLESDGGKGLLGSLSVISSGMSSMFSQISSLMQAELEIQTASIEKRYDKEIERAEGNSYRIAYLEKKKEKEIAQAKNEANKKMFAMQVIQAVAQTAQNALNAYGSAASVPVVGYILAPIAAAMAVAAGAIQIAAIKKQQQASEAQGYAEGGFTPAGDKYREVGVVHAGEWVASQELVNSPVARPVINALEYAQRNNRIGSLRMQDISGQNIVQMSSYGRPSARSVAPEVQISGQNDRSSAVMENLNAAIANLNNRLAEPLAAITTVAGDYGINKAQADYAMLLKNKSPKFK